MSPSLSVEPGEGGLSALLLALEERLLDPGFRRDRAAVGALLADGFREFGSSGRVFDRAAILDLLEQEPASSQPVAGISDFALAGFSEDAALVTYTATGGASVTRRSSLWILRDGRWLLLFHQGTHQGTSGDADG